MLHFCLGQESPPTKMQGKRHFGNVHFWVKDEPVPGNIVGSRHSEPKR